MSKIEIERASDRVKVIIYTAKPGVVIGKGGAEIDKLKEEVQKLSTKKVLVDVKEVKDEEGLILEKSTQSLKSDYVKKLE